jgi:hypothetical protein
MVHVNRGRWVVDCPGEECSWSYLALAPDGRPRYLHRCGGDHTGPGCGTMFSLVWPALDEAEQIVEALRRRTDLAARNWLPHETVDMLLAENDTHLVGCDLAWLAEHGIGVV